MKTLVLAITLVPCALVVHGQQDSSWIRYQGGFDFREGIYRDFNAFRLNAPSISLEKLTDDQGLAVRDIRRTTRFFHLDSLGERQEIDLNRAWGFCNNDIVYLRAGDGFYRIGLMGALCHVLFEYNYRELDPYYGVSGTVNTVQVQYLLDMSNGAFMPFTAESMGQALMNDSILKEEWDLLTKKERRKPEALHLFMRRYNERHPLCFPR